MFSLELASVVNLGAERKRRADCVLDRKLVELGVRPRERLAEGRRTHPKSRRWRHAPSRGGLLTYAKLGQRLTASKKSTAVLGAIPRPATAPGAREKSLVLGPCSCAWTSRPITVVNPAGASYPLGFGLEDDFDLAGLALAATGVDERKLRARPPKRAERPPNRRCARAIIIKQECCAFKKKMPAFTCTCRDCRY